MIADRLAATGAALLATAGRLFGPPLKFGLPMALTTLVFDPAVQLEAVLEPILSQGAGSLPVTEETTQAPPPLQWPPRGRPDVASTGSQPARSNPPAGLTPQPATLRPFPPPGAEAGALPGLNEHEGALSPPEPFQTAAQSPSSPAAADALTAVYRSMAALNLPLPSQPGTAASARQQSATSREGASGGVVASAQSLRVAPGAAGVAAADGRGPGESPAPRPGAFPARYVEKDAFVRDPVFTPLPERVGSEDAGWLPGPPVPSTGVNMVRGGAGLAAILAANVQAATLQTDGMEIEPAETQPLPAEPEALFTPNWSGDREGAEIDMERILDELANALELELIRTYGTSGR